MDRSLVVDFLEYAYIPMHIDDLALGLKARSLTRESGDLRSLVRSDRLRFRVDGDLDPLICPAIDGRTAAHLDEFLTLSTWPTVNRIVGKSPSATFDMEYLRWLCEMHAVAVDNGAGLTVIMSLFDRVAEFAEGIPDKYIEKSLRTQGRAVPDVVEVFRTAAEDYRSTLPDEDHLFDSVVRKVSALPVELRLFGR